MDATTVAAKAVAPSTDDADNAPSSQRAAAPKPAPGQEEPLPASTADMAPPPTTTTRATSAEFGDEDEQVEKFYELLANIRALRAMHARGSGNADASTDDTASDKVCGGVRKRARWAEQPWRPTFRMEDFEEAPGGSAFMKDTRDDEGAATSRWPGKKTMDEAADGESDDA
ncbi:NRR repressor homolog 1-like [Lolium rigidum]|uniref:NRR repressor homolog 1-like n=1 Tax=Lolium rigidum TaxID=89674 RepID=UPI001F5D8B39|nr:NRR repressor homolog 1-like [Lolium rigidum]